MVFTSYELKLRQNVEHMTLYIFPERRTMKAKAGLENSIGVRRARFRGAPGVLIDAAPPPA